MTVISSPALASLKISRASLESDALLSLICSLTPLYQVKIEISKEKGKSVELCSSENTTKLHHRNAIVRYLCGMGLHNAMDTKYSVLGGCACPGMQGLEDGSALVLSGISSWMSVACSIRSSGEEERNVLLDHLEVVLEHRSYLVNSGCATLADMDVYLAIGGVEADVGVRGNVRRWLDQVHTCLCELKDVAVANRPDMAKYVTLVDPLPQENYPAPLFFYGDDAEDPIVAEAPQPSKRPTASAKPQSDNRTQTAPPAQTNELTEEQKKAAAEKRAKKNAEKAAKKKDKKQAAPPQPAELSPNALDIRVGKILKAWNHETADKLYCEEIDIGEPTPRKIASGLRPFYTLDQIQNRTVLVLCNLKPRNLVGFPSHGMVLCASDSDHTQVEFVSPPDGAGVGERVVFEGMPDIPPESETKMAKKKIFEKIAVDLKTDEDGIVVWKNKKAVTSKGACFAVNRMAGGAVA